MIYMFCIVYVCTCILGPSLILGNGSINLFKHSFPYLQESGVKFKYDNVELTFRGTITTFSADNLAAWNVGGFKALGSAFRKCQYCMAVDEDIQTKVYNTNNWRIDSSCLN